MSSRWKRDTASVSVDKELEEIRKGIAGVHKTLYKLTRQMETVGGKVDETLTDFDTAVGEVREDVHHAKVEIFKETAKFPRSWEYLAVNFLVELAIWAFAAFLLYKIVQQLRILRRARADDSKPQAAPQPGTPPPAYAVSEARRASLESPYAVVKRPAEYHQSPYAGAITPNEWPAVRLAAMQREQAERMALLASSEHSTVFD